MSEAFLQCANCRKSLRPGARFCTRCGTTTLRKPVSPTPDRLQSRSNRAPLTPARRWNVGPWFLAAIPFGFLALSWLFWNGVRNQESSARNSIIATPAEIQVAAPTPPAEIGSAGRADSLVHSAPNKADSFGFQGPAAHWNCRITNVALIGQPSNLSPSLLQVNYTVQRRQLAFHAKLVASFNVPSTPRGSNLETRLLNIASGADSFSGEEFFDIPAEANSCEVSIQDAKTGIPLTPFTRVEISPF